MAFLQCNQFFAICDRKKKSCSCYVDNIIIDDPGQNVTFLLSTMWKFENFSVNHILREIKIRGTIWSVLKVHQTNVVVFKGLDLTTLISRNFLSGRKILHFSHCGWVE